MERVYFRSRTYSDILLLTISAFVIRSVVFVSIGSYVPILLTLSMGSLILLGVFTGRKWLHLVLKTWALLLILFGTMRYSLWAMVYFSGIDEIHIIEQFTIMFNVFNILAIGSGLYLFRKTNRMLVYL